MADEADAVINPATDGRSSEPEGNTELVHLSVTSEIVDTVARHVMFGHSRRKLVFLVPSVMLLNLREDAVVAIALEDNPGYPVRFSRHPRICETSIHGWIVRVKPRKLII